MPYLMLSIEDAMQTILSAVKRARVERIPFYNALGRISGEDIYSELSIPPFDNSAMDGYALLHSDIIGASRENPVKIKVLEDLPAGYTAKNAVHPGESIRIMTGAPVPRGADTVVMHEDTEKEGVNVIIYRDARKGENIRIAGEDVLKGELIIRKGTKLRAQEIGLLASIGVNWLTVYQKPRVAILTTGDEIVEPGSALGEGQIYTSNSFTLYNQVKDSGGIPHLIGTAKDNEEALQEKLTQAANNDIILTSGGISTGDYDFVKKVLNGMGASIKFWKVAIKPGKPFAFGKLNEKLFFGLPGNPVSSMVTFEEFVKPAILKMAGINKIFNQMFKAELTEVIKKKPGRAHFVRARVTYKSGKFYATTTGEQGSGMLKSMVIANALLFIEPESTSLNKGDMVNFQLLSPLSSDKFKEET